MLGEKIALLVRDDAPSLLPSLPLRKKRQDERLDAAPRSPPLTWESAAHADRYTEERSRKNQQLHFS